MSTTLTDPTTLSSDTDEMLKLRVAGHSFDYIAAKVGNVSAATVAKRLREVATRNVAARDERIALQYERIQWLWRRLLAPYMNLPLDTPLPKHVTADAIKLLEREAKLFGLDEPTKVAATLGLATMDDAALHAEAMRLGIPISVETVDDSQQMPTND